MSIDQLDTTALIERVSEGLVSLDTNGQCTYINRQAERFLGKKKEELLGRILWAELPAWQRSSLAEEWRCSMEVQKPRSFEERDERWGGWAEIRIFPAPDGATIYFSDITERKQREEQLRQSSQTYSRLMDTLGGIVWVADGSSFRFLYVSEQAERILGYPVQQWLDEPDFWRNHTHPDDVERSTEFCRAATERGEDHAFEYRMIAADGRAIWFRDIVSVERDETGRPRLRGILVEISEQKRLAHQHAKLWRDLEKRVSEFAALASAAYLVQRSDWEISAIARELVTVLPSAFQYPELAAARIQVNGVRAASPNFRETAAHLVSDCRCSDGVRCVIEVVYLEESPVRKSGAFLPEEHLLLQSVADMLRLAYDRRLAIQTLEQYEEHFRSLVENGWDGIAMVDRDGKLLYQSPSVERMLGYSPDELRNWAELELVSSEDARRGERFISQVFEKGEAPTHFECRCRHHDGSWRIIEAIGRRIVNAHGRVVALLNARDVTERSESERRLRESEARFRDVFRGSGVGMTITDLSYQFLEVNAAFCNLIGYSEDELRKLTLRDVTHPDDWPLNERADAEVRAGLKQVVNLEKRYVRKDGKVVWGYVTLVYLFREGQPVLRVAVVQDITAQKQAQDELRRRDSFYRSLLENSSDSITVVNSDGVIEFQSPAIQQQLGFTWAEMIGRKVFDVVHPKELPKAVKILQDVLDHDQVSGPFEFRCQHKNGSWIILESLANRFVDDDGKNSGHPEFERRHRATDGR